jgi:hypothetical protein
MSTDKAIGIVFLYNKDVGGPEKVSTQLSDYFSDITQNLVNQELLGLPDLKEIMDEKKIYFGGIKRDFKKILNDNESIVNIAWEVYNQHTGIEASDEVKVLIYDGDQTPWKFTLMACVLYQ